MKLIKMCIRDRGQSDLAENNEPNGDIQVHEDPYEDYVQDIIDEFQNAEDDNDEDDGVKPEGTDLKSMKAPLAGEIIREFTLDVYKRQARDPADSRGGVPGLRGAAERIPQERCLQRSTGRDATPHGGALPQPAGESAGDRDG